MPRMLRKSIHELHVLHPNFWLKSLFAFMRPFVSSKFWRKLHYTDHIAEVSAHRALYSLVRSETVLFIAVVRTVETATPAARVCCKVKFYALCLLVA